MIHARSAGTTNNGAPDASVHEPRPRGRGGGEDFDLVLPDMDDVFEASPLAFLPAQEAFDGENHIGDDHFAGRGRDEWRFAIEA